MKEAYVSGQDEILRLAFQTAITGSGGFYVGLGTGPIPEGRTKTLADVTEVEGQGYARALVKRTADAEGWELDGGVITTPVLTFTNSSADPENFWSDADYAFLTLSPEGLDAPVVIFSSSELTETFILAGGVSKQIIVDFSLTS